ncbi:MAG TPA: helix-turn-helix domain-containing protein [Solirubrobacteraceae bacterium]|nr:helix-turn-helix domain-containing protein [Solirubrobacteraceae bacterium]
MTFIIKTVDELAHAARSRRRELGLSQQALADVIDVHRAFIIQFEQGKSSVRLDLVLRLVQALGMDVELRVRQ